MPGSEGSNLSRLRASEPAGKILILSIAKEKDLSILVGPEGFEPPTKGL